MERVYETGPLVTAPSQINYVLATRKNVDELKEMLPGYNNDDQH